MEQVSNTSRRYEDSLKKETQERLTRSIKKFVAEMFRF
jgi:hypothetical protein